VACHHRQRLRLRLGHRHPQSRHRGLFLASAGSGEMTDYQVTTRPMSAAQSHQSSEGRYGASIPRMYVARIGSEQYYLQSIGH
jgi:hypothetical protein